MLKNVNFIKIGQCLGVAQDRQSFSTKRAYVEWSYHENSNFFPFFIRKLYFSPLNLNSLWKMCSFEVHHVECWCSSKIKKLGGGTHKLIKLQLQLMRPPPTFLIFELLSHNALQKNTFFMQNSDSEEKSIIF